MALTAESVMAAHPDAQPTGEAYCELAMTGAIVAGVPPLWRREIAAFLRGILARAPLKTSEAYEPHRAVLGALLLELEMWAVRQAEDQPEPSVADLRDPKIVARERDAVLAFRQWADSERIRGADAYRAHIDEIVAEGDARHEAAMAQIEAQEAAAAAPIAPAPVQPAEEAPNAIPDWL